MNGKTSNHIRTGRIMIAILATLFPVGCGLGANNQTPVGPTVVSPQPTVTTTPSVTRTSIPSGS